MDDHPMLLALLFLLFLLVPPILLYTTTEYDPMLSVILFSLLLLILLPHLIDTINSIFHQEAEPTLRSPRPQQDRSPLSRTVPHRSHSVKKMDKKKDRYE
jgi:hypothetical protein